MNKQNVITGLVPKGETDNWLGYMDSFDQLLQAIAPFMLVKFLQDEEWGPYPYEECNPLPANCQGTRGPLCPCVWSKDFGSNDSLKEGSFLLAAAVVTVFSMVPYGMLIAR